MHVADAEQRALRSELRRHRALALLIAVLLAAGVWSLLAGIDQDSAPAAAVPPPRAFSLSPLRAGQLRPPAALRTPQPGSIQRSCTPEPNAVSRVDIPSLCIYAPLRKTHAVAGALLIPPDVHDVGLDENSAPLSGHVGTTIIAGHVNFIGQGQGSFYFLHDVKPGADISVSDAAGHRTQWRVYQIRSVRKSELPGDIWATRGPRRLVLVTCGGALLHGPAGNTYEDNVLVYAAPGA